MSEYYTNRMIIGNRLNRFLLNKRNPIYVPYLYAQTSYFLQYKDVQKSFKHNFARSYILLTNFVRTIWNACRPYKYFSWPCYFLWQPHCIISQRPCFFYPQRLIRHFNPKFAHLRARRTGCFENRKYLHDDRFSVYLQFQGKR